VKCKCTKIAQNQFLDDILGNNPGAKNEKNEKKFKKRLLGPQMSGLNCVKMDPKYTISHSIPDVTPRKNKNVRSVRDTICGVFRYLFECRRILKYERI
jgi:hypothetical protein